MSASQSIAHLNAILTELGMDGRPTLEKCKEIKRKREFEAEMREIDPSNIVSGSRRKSSATSVKPIPVIESSSESSSNDESDDEVDWKALGDAETSEPESGSSSESSESESDGGSD